MNSNIYNFHDWLIEKDISFYSEATFAQNAIALGTIIGSLIFGTAGINLLKNMPQAELANSKTPVELATKITQYGQQQGLKPKEEPTQAAKTAVKKVQNTDTSSPSVGTGDTGGQDSDTIYFIQNPNFEGHLTPGVKPFVQCDKDGNILPNGIDYQKARMNQAHLDGPDVKLINKQNSADSGSSLNAQLRGK